MPGFLTGTGRVSHSWTVAQSAELSRLLLHQPKMAACEAGSAKPEAVGEVLSALRGGAWAEGYLGQDVGFFCSPTVFVVGQLAAHGTAETAEGALMIWVTVEGGAAFDTEIHWAGWQDVSSSDQLRLPATPELLTGSALKEMMEELNALFWDDWERQSERAAEARWGL